jgi:mRNA-degrading endonuclease HigB of HigAB toxin-antitoxin module
MFSYVRDEEILVRIVDFLEKTYKLPENIKGNVFLMEKMYKFFVDKNIVPELEGRPLRLDEFLAF